MKVPTQQLLDVKFAEIEQILEDGLENGELQQGVFGATVGSLFISGDGVIFHKIESASVLRALASQRRAELAKEIAYHRDQLAHYEDQMDKLNELAK